MNTKVSLANLIDILNKKYNDVLDGIIDEDELWIAIMQVRKKISEGRGFITNKKSIQDLENIVISLSILKNELRDANLEQNLSEASKFRNQFLQSAQRYFDNLLDFTEKLEQSTPAGLLFPSQTEEIVSQSFPSQTEEIVSQSFPSQTEEIVSQSIAIAKYAYNCWEKSNSNRHQ